MTKGPEPAPFIKIEPLDTAKHDRAAFSCGVDQIDNFFKRLANQQQKREFTKVWVAVSTDNESAVLGFYATNSHSIPTDDLPEKLRKGAPRQDRVGAAYISMVGVTADAQGTGIGTVLMIDALKRIATAATQVGIFTVVLDVVEDEHTEKRKAWYTKLGFLPFPSQPLRMFIPISTVRRQLKV